MNPGVAFASGLAAGFAVAVPLGAIGVLLVREGISRGLRGALPAATAVAAVLGALAAPLVARWGPWPGLAGGGALLALAAMGLARSLRRGSAPAGAAAVVRGSSAPSGSAAVLRPGRGLQRFAMFFGLTLVNPATLVYFAAIAAGLPELSGDGAAATAFVAGVGAASLAWQALLVSGGGLLRRSDCPGLQRASGIVGSAVVGVFGLFLLAGAVR